MALDEQVVPLPSAYMQTMALSSTELFRRTPCRATPGRPTILEFLDVGQYSNHKDTGLSIDQPLFEPIPAEIRFQNCEPLQTYELPLLLRNVDRVARKVKVMQSASPHFKIIPPKEQSSKVAAGMQVQYLVRFSPDQARDYTDEIICVTEREKFAIVVQATGPRALLDLPDAVHFDSSPVKHPSTKVLLVRNVGHAEANFCSWTEGPYELQPTQGSLAVGGTMQLQITFQPTRNGSHTGKAYVQYDTGEAVAFALHGTAHDLDLMLDISKVFVPSTFIGLAQRQSVKLCNRSSFMVHFDWKLFATAVEEEAHRLSFLDELTATMTAVTVEPECRGLAPSVSGLRGHNQPMLQQTLRTRQLELQRDGLLYDDTVFRILPSKGDIWPHSEQEVTVLFSPAQAGLFTRLVYCDITGREDRLALQLQGQAVGPTVQLSFDSLDLGSVFRGSTHVYELVLRNTGDIPATFETVPSVSAFSAFFAFEPSSATLVPGDEMLIQVHFSPTALGAVDEDFQFAVREALEPISLNFRGKVVAPTFHASAAELDFSGMPVGFVSSRALTLSNTSTVPIEFTLRMDPEDPHRQDYEITPATGTIPPQSELHIQIDLKPTTTHIYDTFLCIDIAEVGHELLTIPIFGESLAPRVITHVDALHFGHCFVNHPVNQTLTLQNTSAVPARIEVVGTPADHPSLTIETGPPLIGIIPPLGSADVTIALIVKCLGPSSGSFGIQVAGQPVPLTLGVTAVGEGPVVSVQPRMLEWGKQAVLLNTPKTLTLRNESPIPASLSCSFQAINGGFFCQPEALLLAPGEKGLLIVGTNLRDTIKHMDVLTLQVNGGTPLQLPLSAHGIGSTVTCAPALDEVDFGTQLSTCECRRTFMLRNQGQRKLKLTFSAENPAMAAEGLFCAVMRGSAFLPKATASCPRPPEPRYTNFGVSPERLVLEPGGSTEIIVSGSSETPQTVAETILCAGTYEDSIKSRVLFKARISAVFVQPMLRPSVAALTFHITPDTLSAPSSMGAHTMKALQLTNVTQLPLRAEIYCRGPFAAVALPDLVQPQESISVNVSFQLDFADDRVDRTEHGQLLVAYKDHPQVDVIDLNAQLAFPNIRLSASVVDFGHQLEETLVRQTLTLFNPGPTPVSFYWALQESALQSHALRQLLDFLPLRGTVASGESASTVVSFFALPGCAVQAIALLRVDHGPTYTVEVTGRAASPLFRLDREQVDFGLNQLGQQVHAHINIFNEGLAPLPFKVLDPVPAQVSVEPSVGLILAGSKQALKLGFLAKLPAVYQGLLRLQLAHHSPYSIVLTSQGTYQHLTATLPRLETKEVGQLIQQARELLGPTAPDAEVQKEVDRVFVAQQVLKSPNKAPEVVTTTLQLPPYLLDFGHVTPGSTVRRSFQLRNDGNATISFKVLKKSLQGFTLAPDRVLKLPVGTAVDMEAKFSAQGTFRAPLQSGLYEVVVPVQLTDGPRLMVVLRATMAEPALSLSTPALDFGSVQCGQVRIVHLELHNPSALTCAWSSRRGKENRRRPTAGLSRAALAVQQQAEEMARCYELVPSHGTLAPGATMKIQARFAPVVAASYVTTIPFSIVDSANRPVLVCAGQGLEPQLRIEPEVFLMGPVLPQSEGQEAAIQITNLSNFPVDFFAAELDHEHVFEEQVLRLMEGYDKQRRLLLPPRAPGASLPPQLYQAAALQRVVPLNNDQSANSALKMLATVPMAVEEVKIKQPAQAALDQFLGVDVRQAQMKADLLGLNVVVAGPALTGKSTLAAHLAQLYHASVHTLDAIVQTELQGDSDLADKIRNIWALQHEERAISTDHQSNAGSQDAASRLYLPEELLLQLVAQRVSQPAELKGVVFDGLDSQYCSPMTAATVLLRALAQRQHFAFVFLQLDPATAEARWQTRCSEERAVQEQQSSRQAMAALVPPALMEDEYDGLDEEAKQVFDAQVLVYNRHLMRQKQCAAEAKERHAEEMRRLLEEEKSKSKRSKTRQARTPNEMDSNSLPESPGPRAAGHKQKRREEAETPLICPVDTFSPVQEELIHLFGDWDIERACPRTMVARQLSASGKMATAKKCKPLKGGDQTLDTFEEAFAPSSTLVHYSTVSVDQLSPEGTVDAVLQHLPSVSEIEANLSRDWTETWPDQLDLDLVAYPPVRPPANLPEQFMFFDAETRRAALAAAAAAEATAGLEDDDKKSSSKRPDSQGGKRLKSVSTKVASAKKTSSKAKTVRRGAEDADLVSADEALSVDPTAVLSYRLDRFRWTVAPGASLTLHVRFQSSASGTFDQTLTFQTVRGGFQFPVHLRGICVYPQVSLVFPKTQYHAKAQTVDFGPVLAGKSRDDYKGDPGSANHACVVLSNSTGHTTSVTATLTNDLNFTTFTLDPSTVVLAPNGQAELHLWAFPRSPVSFTDRVVLSIKNNPEPLFFAVKADGVEPALELDRKILAFDRTLLRRTDTKSLILRNKTRLPVAWAIAGAEQLGSEFCLHSLKGVVGPLSDFALNVTFRAERILTVKKPLRLEVSDVDSIAGIVQTEAITVTAEAYDVALDLSFPRSSHDLGLDFEKMRVGDEKSVVCVLKNKGKYELKYHFLLDKAKCLAHGLSPDHVTILPQSGTLAFGERSLSVKMTVQPVTALHITRQVLVKCCLEDPFRAETIADIPIPVTLQSDFSSYRLQPARGLSFGPLSLGTGKVTREILLENTGGFDFHYYFTPSGATTAELVHREDNAANRKSILISASHGALLPKKFTRASSVLSPSLSNMSSHSQKISVGCFTIAPASGVAHAGTTVKVLVEADPQSLGPEQCWLQLEVEQRAPEDHPEGIFYPISMEACNPEISTDLFPDVATLVSCVPLSTESMFSPQERALYFGPVLINEERVLRVKLFNQGKVPGTVLLSCGQKNLPKKPLLTERFVVEPSRLLLQPHAHAFAIVRFQPTALQNYTAEFEAVLEGVPDTAAASRLDFSLRGQGALPRVLVAAPTTRTAQGTLLIQYRRTRVGTQRLYTLQLHNPGQLESRTTLHFLPLDARRPASSRASRAGSKRPSSGRPKTKQARRSSLAPATPPEGFPELGRRASVAMLASVEPERLEPPLELLEPLGTLSDGPFAFAENQNPVVIPGGSTAAVHLVFSPIATGLVTTQLRLAVQNNDFETCVVEVVGEGYMEDFELEGLAEGDVLDFGHPVVGEPSHRTFRLINYTETMLRFVWALPAQAPDYTLTCQPLCAQIDVGGACEVTVQLLAQQPVVLPAGLVLTGEVTRIRPAAGVQGQAWSSTDVAVSWVVAEDNNGRLVSQQQSEAVREPAFILLDEEPARAVQVNIAAQAQMATFSCETKEVSFEDTFLFQSRVLSFPLINTADVEFSFTWTFANDSMLEDPQAICPFTVEPERGRLGPKDTLSVRVRFVPDQLNDWRYLLRCDVPHAAPDNVFPELLVTGRSMQPFVHFELPPVDLVAEGYALELPSTLTSHTLERLQVVDVVAFGLKQTVNLSIQLRNTSMTSYEFKWRCLADEYTRRDGQLIAGPLACLTPVGTLLPKQDAEAKFVFQPSDFAPVASWWEFTVPAHDLVMPVLVRGTASQPDVMMMPTIAEVGLVMVGQAHEVQVALVNRDTVAHNFSFRNRALAEAQRAAQVNVTPMTGVLAAGETFAVIVSLTPKQEQSYSLALECHIRHCLAPLPLMVRMEGFRHHVTLTELAPVPIAISGSLKGRPKSSPHVVLLGDVAVGDCAGRSFVVRNAGQQPVEFAWELPAKLRPLRIVPAQGTLLPQASLTCELSFTPTARVALKEAVVLCRVTAGPQFSLQLSAAGTVPALQASFHQHDFGNVYVHGPGNPPTQVILQLVNQDSGLLHVSCPFINSGCWQVDFGAAVRLVEPGGCVAVTITFTPALAQLYREMLNIVVNQNHRIQIDLKGHGVPLSLTLEGGSQVNLGTIKVNEMVERPLQIVNRSVLPVTYRLAADFQALTALFVSVEHTGPVTLAPKESAVIKVRFAPLQRVPAFREDLGVEVFGRVMPLAIIAGACHGLSVALDQDQICFGAVVSRGRAVRPVVLVNRGDVGTRFSWRWPAGFELWFTLTPSKGYLSPGQELTCDLICHPASVQANILYEGIACELELGPTLLLDVHAVAVEAQPERDILQFNLPVRTSESKSLKVTNLTSANWELCPVFDHAYFSGAQRLQVPAGESRLYDVTYAPLMMSRSEHHTGKCFMALPNGQGLMFSLSGVASPPKPVKLLAREVACKVLQNVSFPVDNWLDKCQRFKVQLHTSKGDPATVITGPEYMELPAGGMGEYTLEVMAYREGLAVVDVTFLHEISRESLCYEVNLKIAAPSTLATIVLESVVRCSLAHTVRLSNPLNHAVTVAMACTAVGTAAKTICTEIQGPSSFKLPAHSKDMAYNFEFLPLVPRSQVARLTLTSTELGSFCYQLELHSTPAAPFPAVFFSAALGESVTKRVSITSLAPARSEITFSFFPADGLGFSVPGTVSMPPALKSGSEFAFDVTFEPRQPGDVKVSMTASSSIAGEYVLPLVGQCLPPGPSGPHSVRNGGKLTLPFKNVLSTAATFVLSIDNDAFSIKDKETFKAGEVRDLVIKHCGDGDSDKALLNVTCITGELSGTVWPIYLAASLT